MDGFTGTYRDPRSPAEITHRLTVAVAPLGYKPVAQSDAGATFEYDGRVPGWALILLLLPVLGWIILAVMVLSARKDQRLSVTYRADSHGTLVSVEATDPAAAEMFRTLTPVS